MIAKKFSVTNHIVGVSAIVLCTIVGCLNAGWWRTYGEEGVDVSYFVQQTNDGGYIITGVKGYTRESADLWLLKLDSLGDIVWDRVYGGEGRDWGRCVQQTSDGGFIIIGTTVSFGAGDADIWLLKTDSLGDTVWTKTFGESRRDEGFFVQQTSDNGYVFCGNGDKFEVGDCNFWVFKTDIDGNLIWDRWDHDFGSYSVREIEKGNFIVVGDGVVELDESGYVVWSKYYGHSFGDRFYSFSLIRDDGYVFCGYTEVTDTTGYDLWIMKTDKNGDSLWEKYYGGEFGEMGFSIYPTKDGGYIISGLKDGEGHLFSNSDLWLLKTDTLGDTLWTKTFGGDSIDIGYCVQQTTDKGFIISGVYNRDDWGLSQGELYLIKTDSLGLLGVEEPEAPVTHQPDWQVANPIGRAITLRTPEGDAPLNLAVFDASGRMVDELSLYGSATITWGECYGPGVYFIRESSGKTPLTRKVILVK